MCFIDVLPFSRSNILKFTIFLDFILTLVEEENDGMNQKSNLRG